MRIRSIFRRICGNVEITLNFRSYLIWDFIEHHFGIKSQPKMFRGIHISNEVFSPNWCSSWNPIFLLTKWFEWSSMVWRLSIKLNALDWNVVSNWNLFNLWHFLWLQVKVQHTDKKHMKKYWNGSTFYVQKHMYRVIHCLFTRI